MVICQADPEVVTRVVLGGESVGTLFLPASEPVVGHKRWILSTPVRGQVGLVAGAAEGLRQGMNGLCGADVASAHGEFGAGDAVALCDQEGKEVGRGLAEVSSDGLVEMLVSRGDEHTSTAEKRLVVDQLNVCLLPTGSRAPSSSATSQRDDNDTEDEFASLSVVSSPRGASSGLLSMGSAPIKSVMLRSGTALQLIILWPVPEVFLVPREKKRKSDKYSNVALVCYILSIYYSMNSIFWFCFEMSTSVNTSKVSTSPFWFVGWLLQRPHPAVHLRDSWAAWGV